MGCVPGLLGLLEVAVLGVDHVVGALAAVGEVAGRVDVLDPPSTEFWAQKDDEYTTAFGPRKALRSICAWFTEAGEAT